MNRLALFVFVASSVFVSPALQANPDPQSLYLAKTGQWKVFFERVQVLLASDPNIQHSMTEGEEGATLLKLLHASNNLVRFFELQAAVPATESRNNANLSAGERPSRICSFKWMKDLVTSVLSSVRQMAWVSSTSGDSALLMRGSIDSAIENRVKIHDNETEDEGNPGALVEPENAESRVVPMGAARVSERAQDEIFLQAALTPDDSIFALVEEIYHSRVGWFGNYDTPGFPGLPGRGWTAVEVVRNEPELRMPLRIRESRDHRLARQYLAAALAVVNQTLERYYSDDGINRQVELAQHTRIDLRSRFTKMITDENKSLRRLKKRIIDALEMLDQFESTSSGKRNSNDNSNNDAPQARNINRQLLDALEASDFETAENLLENGANPHLRILVRNGNFLTLIDASLALPNLNLRFLRSLLKRGVEVSADIAGTGVSPLTFLMKRMEKNPHNPVLLDAFRILLESGADWTSAYEYGHHKFIKGNFELAYDLLTQHALKQFLRR